MVLLTWLIIHVYKLPMSGCWSSSLNQYFIILLFIHYTATYFQLVGKHLGTSLSLLLLQFSANLELIGHYIGNSLYKFSTLWALGCATFTTIIIAIPFALPKKTGNTLGTIGWLLGYCLEYLTLFWHLLGTNWSVSHANFLLLWILPKLHQTVRNGETKLSKRLNNIPSHLFLDP